MMGPWQYVHCVMQVIWEQSTAQLHGECMCASTPKQTASCVLLHCTLFGCGVLQTFDVTRLVSSSPIEDAMHFPGGSPAAFAMSPSLNALSQRSSDVDSSAPSTPGPNEEVRSHLNFKELQSCNLQGSSLTHFLDIVVSIPHWYCCSCVRLACLENCHPTSGTCRTFGPTKQATVYM